MERKKKTTHTHTRMHAHKKNKNNNNKRSTGEVVVPRQPGTQECEIAKDPSHKPLG